MPTGSIITSPHMVDSHRHKVDYVGRRGIMGYPLHVAAAILFCCLWVGVLGDLADDARGLTTFKQAIDRNNVLNWSGTDVCSWAGVECALLPSQTTQRVIKLKLSMLRLSGTIPSGSLSQLTELRVINLKGNNLSGSLPSDLSNCTYLRNVFLLNNNFSGSLPLDYSAWPNLGILDVSDNSFSGNLSSSLTGLDQLKRFYVQNNALTGSLPDLNMSSLKEFNVSNNRFSGSIPATYARFDPSAFLGNSLCGFPLPACPNTEPPAQSPAQSPAQQGNNGKKKLSGGAIAGIVIGGLAFLLIVFILCILAYRATSKSKSPTGERNGNNEIATVARDVGPTPPKTEAAAVAASSAEVDRKRLIFFEGNKEEFDIDDLLRASAEVLGKGTLGTSYKAILESGTIVAVKRLKDVSVERNEFEQKMELLGKLKHENLVPLVAYYYSREEKLLVANYMTNGSLSALLHGNKEAYSTPLNWDTRLSIALGTARGILHLHYQDLAHGNIKSSNVLLTSNYTGCISDFGLTQLVNTSSAANRAIGYRAPEITDIRKPTPKSDIYSFGVLLLELLTGKPPSQPNMSDEGWNLPLWVSSVPKEEEDWYAKVFDPELTRIGGSEVQMEKLLDIALECVKPSPDQRPTMAEVVEKLENFDL
ncbi:hypothetical protein KP509_03G030300 [Ceratopteris richardii]|uniref:Protein kinase domain-containing protein n=1 Tax=Ceratopteris richardii TaxID=49495 RepID=A0A8T2UYI8_CERRI|nr:hypothetical protein KP509_03G030300 [Ceratopteris richardii]